MKVTLILVLICASQVLSVTINGGGSSGGRAPSQGRSGGGGGGGGRVPSQSSNASSSGTPSHSTSGQPASAAVNSSGDLDSPRTPPRDDLARRFWDSRNSMPSNPRRRTMNRTNSTHGTNNDSVPFPQLPNIQNGEEDANSIISGGGSVLGAPDVQPHSNVVRNLFPCDDDDDDDNNNEASQT